MASYLEVLMADRERMRHALQAQIDDEATVVREIQADIERRGAELDQKIVRLIVFRGLYGPNQQETMSAQVDVEEASKPHTAALQQLAQRQRVLRALQEALLRVDQTGSVEGPPLGGGDPTIADLLGQ